VLRRAKAEIAEERSTRRSPLSDAEARALLAAVDEVLVARGRVIARLPAKRARLADLRGPTGKYRAPMLRRGRTLLVGLHAEALGRLLAD
jgi:hypothetical protein